MTGARVERRQALSPGGAAPQPPYPIMSRYYAGMVHSCDVIFVLYEDKN